MRRIPSTLAVATTALLLVTGYAIATAAAGDRSGAVHEDGHVGAQRPAGAPVRVAEASNASPVANKSTATAKTPDKLLKLLGERIVARDVDGIIALHEPEAAVVVDYDGSSVRGHKQIRAFYVEWFKSNPVLTVNPRQTVVAGGERGKVRGRTASVMGDYALEQTAPDGTRQSFTGEFCDIMRRQPDGTWLYVLDNPYMPHQ